MLCPSPNLVMPRGVSATNLKREHFMYLIALLEFSSTVLAFAYFSLKTVTLFLLLAKQMLDHLQQHPVYMYVMSRWVWVAYVVLVSKKTCVISRDSSLMAILHSHVLQSCLS